MKSTTSRSLLPLFSCSRTSLRRSRASGALESARVWFWQTRQRSSEAMPSTRFSSTGSSAAGRAVSCPLTRLLVRKHATRNISLTACVQLLQQRLYLVAQDRGRHRADALVADHPLVVDDVGLGHAIDAVVDRDRSGER